ncbi:MAG: DegV family protein [Solobacterium sp.]|nr:DegV family protein [Solobacterium sp.]MCH4221935.1 DegV family protein [Solobacterium sp.]MCH4265540.1 DegV family protein [Solobacterium sp.]
MSDYQVITDATCDMNQDILEAHHIDVIPMLVTFNDGRSFLHYPDFRNFKAKDFYDELRKGNLSHSTQITPATYLEYFSPILEAGKDILYICFSSGMSNTYESSLMAVKQLKEKYPERTIISIDSLCACGGEGVFAVQAALNKEAGMDIETNAKWLNDNKLKLAHYFTVGDLFYLHKGGRVSAATAIVGSALSIKPILIVDEEGKLKMISTAHGKRASLKKLLTMTQQTIVDPENQILYISHTDCLEDAENLKAAVKEAIPCKDVIITTVGPVVGTHTGPTHVCLFSWGTGRRPEK